MNYYDTLGVERNADKMAIKRAYFALVKKHSPEADPEGFRVIRTAYDTLFDDEKRKAYDQCFVADENIQNEMLHASNLLRENNVKQALDFLTELSLLHPKSPDVSLLLVNALMRSGKYGKATTLCTQIVNDHPDNYKGFLLQGNIANARGHYRKAAQIFAEATKKFPDIPAVWEEYIEILFAQNEIENVTAICKAAMEVDENIFQEQFHIYAFCAAASVRFPNYYIKEAALFLRKFNEMLKKQKDYEPDFSDNLFNAVHALAREVQLHPELSDTLDILESKNTGAHREEVAKELQEIQCFVKYTKLRNDSRIHEAIIEMTTFLLDDRVSDNQDERAYLECGIVAEHEQIRPSIKILRKDYPEFFKLNQQFYMDVLNDKKTMSLMEKYYKLSKKYRNDNPFIYDDDGDDELDEFFSFMEEESQKPYVREQPKVGRNDPCPCGSGKKYKKCCGK